MAKRENSLETTIIQRYQKREISVEEDLVEMYLAGVYVRRVKYTIEALWGGRVNIPHQVEPSFRSLRASCSEMLSTTNAFIMPARINKARDKPNTD